MLDSRTLPGLKYSFPVLYFLLLSHFMDYKGPKTLANGPHRSWEMAQQGLVSRPRCQQVI